ncbi:Elongator complex protein 1 [Linum perenne]
MNNLKLYSEISLNIELQSQDEKLLFSAFDIERNRLFFASSANFVYNTQLSSFQDGKSWKEILLSAEIHLLDLENGDVITSFDYLMEKEALVLGTSNGLLLLHMVDDNVTEVVGQVEGGVKCVSPSPDGDLLSVVTGSGQLLVMTHDWDVLYETSIEDHPPDGVDVSKDLSTISKSSVSWRGDGKYFSTLSEMKSSSSSSLGKKLKIWERDSGSLHAMSDAKTFMGAVMEWMPSGAKIAAVYDRKAKDECPAIVFYERNGLYRSSYTINGPKDATVEILKWNCSSDLLASVVRYDKHDAVKIWYFSNNHWYLKHEVRFPSQDGVSLMWDPIKPLQLICWTLRGQVTVYNLTWVTSITESSIALVIDDSKILVTPLSLSLMPPPLYLFHLKLPSAVRDVALHSRGTKNRVAAFLSDGSLCVAELPESDSWEELEGKELCIDCSIPDIAFGSLSHLTWLDSHSLLAVSHYGSSHNECFTHGTPCEEKLRGSYLQEIELMCSEDHVPGLITNSGWHGKISHKNYLEGLVIAIASNPANVSSAFVQFDGGKVLNYHSKSGLAVTEWIAKHDGISFPSSCPMMGAALVSDGGSLQPLLVGLDDIGRLHVGQETLCNNCSSFSFYSNLADEVTTHLILSTKQDFLFIVNISDILHGEIESKYQNFFHLGVRKREEENANFINIWERGAKVVGVLHGDEAAVIIQTTRGNLECIYPRKLVLSSIINALIQRRFKDALLMVRRHRIDFNVLVDYCGWQAFLESASEFVRQIDNLSYVTEFVCAVRSGNIMETLYKNYVSLSGLKETDDVQAKIPDVYDNKVSSILLAVRKALEEQVSESPGRELCILTTLARSEPPALEVALERIKVIREMELLGSDDPRKATYPSAEEALKHLLWLSDSEAVFEAALGLYDLNLAAIVALNSQRDPKEFLPYLAELERMPSLIMQYNIDLRLNRLDNALKHIIMAGDAYYIDCLSLLKKNPKLFPLGLQLITDPTKRMQVLEAWADHLSDEKSFEDAATNYLCCSRLDKALKAYRDCGNWTGVLTVASLLKIGKDEMMQLAHDLCEELQAMGKPAEAAKIALEYCGDVPNGISLLISAREWEDALRISFMHMQDKLVSEVQNASLECASTLSGEYEEGIEKVGKYLTRYLAVRQRRLLLAAKLRSEERSVNDLDDDTASEASSNFSGMSAYTTGTRRGSAASVSSNATSRARDARRQKSRGKIRPGSPGEEMALVEHLKGMSLATGAIRELKSLLSCLIMLGSEEVAKKLQRVAESFQLSQMAAVKLAEDTLSSDSINEEAHALERYVEKVKADPQTSPAMSWRCKVFISP